MPKVALICGILCARAVMAFDLSMFAPPAQQKTSLRVFGLHQSQALHTGLSASVPIYRGEKDAITISPRTHWLKFAPEVHSDLYDIQLGVTYSRQVEEKRSWSISPTYGSASDKPFKDSSVNTIGATATYTIPGGESSTWVFLLNYSNNRPILNNIPLPGFAYIYAPSKSFRGTFGAPFASLYWEFIDKWSLNLLTIAPWIAKAQVAYSVMGPIQVFSGIDFSQSTFLTHGRANPQERTYYDEKKAFLGVRSPLNQSLFTELETGHSFNRRIFAAESYELNPPNALELEASWYLRVVLSMRF